MTPIRYRRRRGRRNESKEARAARERKARKWLAKYHARRIREKTPNPHGGGNTLVILLLVGVGGYFLWQWFASQTAAAAPVITPGTTPTSATTPTNLGLPTQTATATGTTTPATAPTPVTPSVSGQQILQWNQAITNWLVANNYDPNIVQSVFHWNYIAQRVIPNFVDPALNGYTTMNGTQYLQAYVHHLQGLSGLGALGMPTSQLYDSRINTTNRPWAVGDFHAPLASKIYGYIN